MACVSKRDSLLLRVAWRRRLPHALHTGGSCSSGWEGLPEPLLCWGLWVRGAVWVRTLGHPAAQGLGRRPGDSLDVAGGLQPALALQTPIRCWPKAHTLGLGANTAPYPSVGAAASGPELPGAGDFLCLQPQDPAQSRVLAKGGRFVQSGWLGGIGLQPPLVHGAEGGTQVAGLEPPERGFSSCSSVATALDQGTLEALADCLWVAGAATAGCL